MKRCYLVRHAQTTWNHDNRIQGHSDLPLSVAGEEQARRLGALFASRHLNGIYTSHLRRSQQTAHAIASGLPAAPTGNGNGAAQAGNGPRIEPIVERDLAEMHLGDWEGLTPQEVDARFQGAYQQWRQRPSSVVIPGAEPVETFRARTRKALQTIAAGFDNGEYVIVSHGGGIAALLADVLGAEYDAVIRRLRLDNGGVTALEFGTGHPHVLWINATAHLDPTGGELPQPGHGGWF